MGIDKDLWLLTRKKWLKYLKLGGLPKTLGAEAISVLLYDDSTKVLLASGLTMPTNATAGYAKGCIFIKTNAAGGTRGVYENKGTTTSCEFVASGGASPADIPLAQAKLIIGSAGGAGAAQAVTGDIGITAAGLTSITGGAIVNADVNAAAVIAFSKLAALPSAQMLVGNAGSVPTAQAITGDVAITNGGVTTVTDLTITGESQGDVLYRNAANWVRLAAGTSGYYLKTQGAGANPMWDQVSIGAANIIANNAILQDIGALDATLSLTQQTVGAPVLTIPNFASVSDTFAFVTLAQTLVNKTLTSPVLTTPQINDTSADHQYVFAVSELAADRTVTMPLLLGNDTFVFANFIQTLTNKTLTSPVLTTPQINDTSADHQYIFAVSELAADRTVTLPLLAGNDIFTFNDFAAVLKNKTLDDATTKFGDTGDPTKDLFFSLGGATADKTMTITSSHTLDRELTLPNATDTLVGKATTDTLTNKTLNCDGTGNALQNVNGDELDPIAATTGTYGIPIVTVVANAGSADINVFSGNVPWKCRVIDAWAVNTKINNAGNWKLVNGAMDITTTVAYTATDNVVTRVTQIIDGQHVLDGSALHVINSDPSDTSILYVSLLRVD